MMILLRFPTLRAIALTLIIAGLPAARVLGADIAVGGSCSLADAITSANSNSATGNCTAGSGADIITLSADITLTAALPTITSDITIEGGRYAISGDDKYQTLYVK